MSKLLDAVVADVRSLPEDEQDRVAQAVLVLMDHLHNDASWRMI